MAMPSIALLMALAVTAAIVMVTLIPIYLRPWGLISATQRTIYVAITTVLATLISGFLASQVQKLLLLDINKQLQQWEHNAESELPPSLNRRWRNVLKTGGFFEKFRNPGIMVTYTFVSLIVTAIVTSFNPNTTTRNFSYSQKVFNGVSRIKDNQVKNTSPSAASVGNCTSIGPLKNLAASQRYYWDIGNGLAYSIPANLGGCPTRDAQLLVGGINFYDSDTFVYADGGVAVHMSAIGAPHTIYSPVGLLAPEFDGLLSTYGSSTLKTTQCVRVMKKKSYILSSWGQSKFIFLMDEPHLR